MPLVFSEDEEILIAFEAKIASERSNDVIQRAKDLLDILNEIGMNDAIKQSMLNYINNGELRIPLSFTSLEETRNETDINQGEV